MGKPYSIDLRERVVAAVLKWRPVLHRAAKQFGVGISTAINWVKRQELPATPAFRAARTSLAA